MKEKKGRKGREKLTNNCMNSDTELSANDERILSTENMKEKRK